MNDINFLQYLLFEHILPTTISLISISEFSITWKNKTRYIYIIYQLSKQKANVSINTKIIDTISDPKNKTNFPLLPNRILQKARHFTSTFNAQWEGGSQKRGNIKNLRKRQNFPSRLLGSIMKGYTQLCFVDRKCGILE